MQTPDTVPASFTQVEGWREDFAVALGRLRKTRADSLTPDADHRIFGEPVRALTLADWMVLHRAGNPYVCGGLPMGEHAAQVVGLLHREIKRPCSWWGRWQRRAMVWRLMARASFVEAALVSAVEAHVESAFLDMPGAFNKSAHRGTPPTQIERKEVEVSLCGEVMSAYPSMGYDQLRTMPLAQFWQWLHAARAYRDPEYRNDQLTDEINRRFCGKLNDMRKAAQAKK